MRGKLELNLAELDPGEILVTDRELDEVLEHAQGATSLMCSRVLRASASSGAAAINRCYDAKPCRDWQIILRVIRPWGATLGSYPWSLGLLIFVHL